jgi:hypothetical protein
LTTDRLAESEACIGDNHLQPVKLAMRVRFPSPALRTYQLVCPSAQVDRVAVPLTCLSHADPC